MTPNEAAGLAKTDTQWPRWEVFKQDSEKKPHQAVGSVHAADAEHALLMARTVFARRPNAVSMWVAPADRIHSWTAEEIDNLAPTDVAGNSAGGSSGSLGSADATLTAQSGGSEHSPRFLVVVKSSNRRSMTFGDVRFEVQGATPRAALDVALSQLADETVLALWLVESAAVVRSDPEVADPWFGPATDKTYKQQSVYSSLATAKRDTERGMGR